MGKTLIHKRDNVITRRRAIAQLKQIKEERVLQKQAERVVTEDTEPPH